MSVLDPERRERLKEIVQSAVDRHLADQAAFVADACAGDEVLRGEVESLLAYQSSVHTFLERPPGGGQSWRPALDGLVPLEGRRIGQYRLLREIGHGGMGVVYLARRDDQEYRQDVAVKLVRHGLDTDAVIRRFQHERQILANLTHPNIARLLDGGTTPDGLPYFVMEYVEGLPIDEYCDRQALGLVQRLELFRAVCGAVQHAHNNLVVHRDLKPRNIVVTSGGEPKLLDFGIAKVLDRELATAHGELTVIASPMTPEYASPEQVRGEPVTVATDVYALGVVLYELLTGRRPYRADSSIPYELAREICEVQPDKPSTALSRAAAPLVRGDDAPAQGTPAPSGLSAKPRRLRRQLRGDLDNLVLMALRKEPGRRYATVEQLSDDVARYLQRRPLRARPDTLLYRGSRFVQRNRLAVAALSLILVTLFGGIVTTTRAARVAERRFNDVRALANAFVFDFHDAIKDLPGATPARELLVRKALQYLDGLAQESGDAALQLELAAAYQKIGDVQGNQNYSNLGDTAGALASYRKALAIHERLVSAAPANLAARGELSLSHVKIGDMLMQTGDPQAALDRYLRALAIAEAARSAAPADGSASRTLAFSRHKVGNALMAIGDLPGALEQHTTALSLRTALAASAPTDVRARREVFTSQDRVSRVLRRQGDFARALDHARQALAISEALATADPTNAEMRRDVGVGYQSIGLIQMEMNDLRGALEHFRKGLEIDEALARLDPKNAGALRDLVSSHQTIGDVLVRLNDAANAVGSYSDAVLALERLVRLDPENAEFEAALASSLAQLGAAHTAVASDITKAAWQRVEQWRAARAVYQRSLELVLAIGKRGAGAPGDIPSSDELASQITRCDAALRALQG